MFSHRRTVVAVAVLTAGWLGALGGAAGVQADTTEPSTPTAAQTDDQRFVEAVTAMKIPTQPGDDLPAVGHKVCDMLTSGLTGAVNPLPVVRGVRNTLEQNARITRAQAGGLLRASVVVYCPEYSAYIGR